MFKTIRSICLGFCILFVANTASAEVIPDFYAEPGPSAFRDYMSNSVEESIDPFSGSVQLGYQDLVIPGNGGLDIVVNRNYNNMQASLGGRTPVGIGWNMHFGRVLSNGNLNICIAGLSDVSDNPVFESADGSRQIIAMSTTSDLGLTKERWSGGCKKDAQGNPVLDVFIMRSPSGMHYEMAESSFENGETIRHVTRITDTNGNWLNFTYKEVGGTFTKFKVIDTVTSSDGRTVSYAYVDMNTDHVRLSSITANGQTWTYNYTSAIVNHYYYLTSVEGPLGNVWSYDYYTTPSGISPEIYSLAQVTDPRGKATRYTYQYVGFDPSATDYLTTTIASKVELDRSGREIGTWTYSFTQNDVEDMTEVTAPNGTYIYKHYGYRGAANGTLWRVGLIKEKKSIDANNGEVESEVYEWGSQIISNEDYVRPSRGFSKRDSFFYAPIMTKKTITRDGSIYTTDYSNHDVYGNPGRIIENGNDTKQTDLTYFYNTSKWIVKQLKDETILGVGIVSRIFDDVTGNLLEENNYGVKTFYAYHASGDLKSSTNARGFTTSFSNYKRGIAQNEYYPDQSSISKVVNNTGTVASSTNGRLFTTSFTYDRLNRLTNIDYPLNSDVVITYQGFRSQTLTRGAFQLIDTYDDFGRTVKKELKDTTRGVNIVTATSYDAVGQVTFESDAYYDAVPPSLLADGKNYHYDILGRVLNITYADGKNTKFTYLPGNKTKHTNERFIDTINTYRSFGDPGERDLIKIESPESVTTDIVRNKLGQMTKVTQGGLSRLYEYDSRNFLVAMTEPEVGITEYGRDAVGNMQTKSIAGAPTIDFVYDELNRVKSKLYTIGGVQFSSGDDIIRYTKSVNYFYDENSNLIEMKSVDRDNDTSNFSLSSFKTIRKYQYDARDNLQLEELIFEKDTGQNIFTNNYITQYGYDNHDYLSQINYPKGTVVNYNPDALGRPTTVLPFVTGVSYHASGQNSQIIFANGQISQTEIDRRRRPSRYLTFGNSNDVDLTYLYDEVGNVSSITDALEPQYSRTMTYDGLDRLATASGKWGGGNITYDSVGNVLSKNIGATNLGYSYDASNKLVNVSGAKSYAFEYDFRGNVVSNGSKHFFYDFSDRMRYVSGSVSANYDYDGNGQRVRVRKGNTSREYFYADNGYLLGDYDNSGLTYKEYAYLDSQLVAVRDVSVIPPTANAGVDNFFYEGEAGSLNGSASSDSDGTIVSYKWQQISGPSVALSDLAVAIPTFTTPNVTSDSVAVFELTVTDNDAFSTTDTVQISFFDKTPPPPILGLSLEQGDGQNIIRWNSEPKAQSYNIYWSTVPGVTVSTGTKITNVMSPYVHVGLTNGTAYYYVITGVGVYGESEASQEVSTTPGQNGVSTPQDIGVADGLNTGQFQYVNHSDGTSTLYFIKLTDAGNQIYSTTYSASLGWSEPVIESDIGVVGYTGIKLSSDAAGNVVAVYLKGYRLVARHKNAGQTWGPEVVISTNNDVYDERPQDFSVAISADGSAIALWEEFCCGTSGSHYIKTSRYDPITSSWGAPIQLVAPGGDPYSLQIKMDTSGNAVMVWSADGVPSSYDGNYAKVYDRITNTWGETVTLDSQTTGAARLRLALDVSETGTAITAWGGLGLHVKWYAPLTGWSTFTLTDNNAQLGLVKMDVNGNGIVIWDEDGLLYSRRFIDGIGWEANSQFIGYGDASQSDIVYDNSGNILVTWAHYSQPNRTHQSIWMNRFNSVTGWGNPIRVEQVDRSIANLGVPTITSQSNQGALINWVSEPKQGFHQLRSSEYVNLNDAYPQQNSAPIAVADSLQILVEGSTGVLNANKSFDPDGSIVDFSWEQIFGPTVSLIGGGTSTPSFVAPFTTYRRELFFRVKVTDNQGAIAYAVQEVYVDPLPAPTLVTTLSSQLGNVISWRPQPTATSYNLYWGTQPGVSKVTGTVIQNVSSPYTHANLINGQDYYYIITSVNGSSESAPSVEYKLSWKPGWQTPQFMEDINYQPSLYDLFVSSSGESMAVWEQSTSVIGVSDIYANRFVPGSGWTSLSRIETLAGSNTQPVVVTHTNGNSVALWKFYDGVGTHLYASEFAPANGWSVPAKISEGSGVSVISDYQLAIDSSGNVMAVWERDSNIIAKSFSSGIGWAAQVSIGSGTSPHVAMSQNGNGIVTWSAPNISGDPTRNDIFISRYTQGIGWALPETVQENILYSSYGPYVTLNDAKDTSLVWVSRGNNTSSVKSVHYDAVNGWGDITDVTLDVVDVYALNLDVASDVNGNVFASWINSKNGRKLFTSRYQLGVGWSDAVQADLSLDNIVSHNLSVNNAGLAMLIWYKEEQGNVANKSIHTSRYVNNAWTAPEQISDIYKLPSNFASPVPEIGITNQGDAIAMWIQNKGTSNQRRLSVSHYRPLTTDDPFLNNTVPPVVTAPVDVAVEATNYYQTPITAAMLGSATAVDDLEGVLPTTFSPSTLPFGASTVTWSATDRAGNIGTATQLVTVVDTTPPVITAPADINFQSDTPVSGLYLGIARTNDIFSVPTVLNDAPDIFPLGVTVVTWSATDTNGNTGTATQLVTITSISQGDTTPPVVSTPADVTAEATGQTTAIPIGNGIGVDETDGALSATADNLGPYSLGTTTVTWSATDAAGNVGTATQLVTVTDTTAPVITVPAAISQDTNTTDPISVTIGMATATDIFTPVSITNDAPALFPVGATTVTWTATDANGNSSSGTQVVTVNLIDSSLPVVTAPAAITAEATGLTTVVAIGSATATDDIDGDLVATADNLGPYSLGTTTVTWSATDAAGNVGTATQLVTVQDTTAPVITVPAAISQDTNTTDPISVTIGTATATDIFTPVSITNDAPALFPVGATTVTWTATDANGNSSSDTQIVTVNLIDSSLPVVTALAAITAEATGQTTAVAIGSATASDDIDGVLVATADNLGPYPLGTTTVTWSATDAAGNVGTATQLVTVQDTTVPVITVPAAISQDTDTTDPISVTIGTATATDIFTPVTITNDAPALFPNGTTTVTWTAVDDNGNSNTGTQVVTVNLVDSSLPVVTAPAAITAEATGLTTAVDIGSATATDDIDGVLVATADNLGPYSLGTTTVTWSATDAAGNVGTATQLVTVEDTTAPVITVPAAISQDTNSSDPVSVTIGTATATDIFTPVTITNDAPALFPVGATTVTWTATDANGNSSTGTQVVTVNLTSTTLNVEPIINNLSFTFISRRRMQLTASASDPDNGPSPLSYQWTIVSGGGRLSGAATSTPIYRIPRRSRGRVNVTFNLVVSDGEASVQTNYYLSCTGHVCTESTNPVSTSNVEPSIDNLSSEFLSRSRIQLTAIASDLDNGPSPLSYQWTIVSGRGRLFGARTNTPVYRLPFRRGRTNVTFNLIVSDGQASVQTNYNLNCSRQACIESVSPTSTISQ